MFQSRNYGADFIGAMNATQGMLNSQRQLEMAEKERAAQAETRNLQNENLKLDTAKKTAELDREKKLQEFLPRADALLQGKLDPKEQAKLAGVTEELMKDVPYAPSRVEEIPAYRKKLGTLIQGVEAIRSLPASNYVYSRADNVPEINTILDNYQGVLSQERLGKTFTDPDGSITGKAGGTYQTTGVGGFMMMSGEGNKAGFVPLFSVAGEDGKPLMKQDGKPVLVPATQGATNGPDDKLRVVTPEELLTKAGFAYKLMDVADTLGLSDPEKRKAYVSNQLNSYRGEDGAKALAKSLEPKESKLTSHNPEYDLYQDGVKVADGKPKQEKPQAPRTVTVGAGGDNLQELQFNPDTNRYDIPVGKPYPKHAKARGGEGGSGGKGGAAGDGQGLEDIKKEFLALKKKRGDQYTDDSKEFRKYQNGNVDGNGMALPAKTYEEYYGGKESKAHAAITAEMYRLRDLARDTYGYDLIKMRPVGKAPAKGMAAPAQAAPQKVAAAQPKAKAKPITATNKSTGQRIVSYDNGASWQPLM